ncbi:MAG: hypothetical protein ACTSUB_09685 [Candidatus Thorarchaeota archaeon]
MGEFQETQKRVIQILSLIALISPSILEIQGLLQGGPIIIAPELLTHLIFIEHPFWALFMQGYSTIWSSAKSIIVIMPYLTPSLITIFVWFMNCLSPIVVYLVFSQKTGLRRGLATLVIISIVPFIPGIPYYAVGEYIAYIRTPLIIPQILCLGVLAYHYWKQRKIKAHSNLIG